MSRVGSSSTDVELFAGILEDPLSLGVVIHADHKSPRDCVAAAFEDAHVIVQNNRLDTAILQEGGKKR
jgi:hypothetical protein